MKYNHKEAFCLMKYANDGLSEVEWVWNSRDGVTPFLIPSRFNKSFNRALQHVDWHEDVCVPSFIPPVGMRVFINGEAYRQFDGKPTKYPDGSPAYHSVLKEVDEVLHLEFLNRARDHAYNRRRAQNAAR